MTLSCINIKHAALFAATYHQHDVEDFKNPTRLLQEDAREYINEDNLKRTTVCCNDNTNNLPYKCQFCFFAHSLTHPPAQLQSL